jgi:SAM-dependent methyltransferase
MRPGETDYQVIEADYTISGSLHDKKLNMVLQRIDRCGCVLDVGCGTGEMIARLRKDDRCGHIYGIDRSEESIGICMEKFKGDDKITIMNAPLKALAGEYPYRFDYVLLLDVIEHNNGEGIKGILKNAFTLLKPEGKVIITTPGFTDMITIASHRVRGIPYKHLTGHTSYGWLSVIRKAGFEVVEHGTVEFPLIDAPALNRYFHLFGKCHMVVAKIDKQATFT